MKGENEPDCEPRSGTGDGKSTLVFDGIDYPLKTEDILERFRQHPSIRMRPDGTVKTYCAMFKRFAKAKNLDRYTRKQIAGSKGKKLILEHIADSIPLRSRRCTLAGIRKVWTFVLDLPWPIDVDRDIGQLPKAGRRGVPRDSAIEVWNNRMRQEPNTYLQCLFDAMAQTGHRASTLAKLKWGHLRYDEDGKPCEIRANGADEGFKRFADVATHVSPDLAEELIKLRQWLGNPDEDALIFPRMDLRGNVDPSRETDHKQIRAHFVKLGEKYGLPDLLPSSLRHWVTAVCQDLNLPEQARAYMMGHEQPIRNMGDVYNNRDIETNLARQAQVLPYGPLGKFAKAEAGLENEFPKEVVDVLRGYRENRKGFDEVLRVLEQWRLSAKQEAPRLAT